MRREGADDAGWQFSFAKTSATAPPRTKQIKLKPGGETMLWTICVILLVLWLLGAFVVPFGGSLIHILLVIAVVILIINLVSGRRGI
jgi:cytosine/uracil/thiamine/allantoin permease